MPIERKLAAIMFTDIAGSTIADPTTLGWLHPSNFINEQNQTN